MSNDSWGNPIWCYYSHEPPKSVTIEIHCQLFLTTERISSTSRLINILNRYPFSFYMLVASRPHCHKSFVCKSVGLLELLGFFEFQQHCFLHPAFNDPARKTSSAHDQAWLSGLTVYIYCRRDPDSGKEVLCWPYRHRFQNGDLFRRFPYRQRKACC